MDFKSYFTSFMRTKAREHAQALDLVYSQISITYWRFQKILEENGLKISNAISGSRYVEYNGTPVYVESSSDDRFVFIPGEWEEILYQIKEALSVAEWWENKLEDQREVARAQAFYARYLAMGNPPLDFTDAEYAPGDELLVDLAGPFDDNEFGVWGAVVDSYDPLTRKYKIYIEEKGTFYVESQQLRPCHASPAQSTRRQSPPGAEE